MRIGGDYLEALRDGRAVFVDGARVADVTEHPAFAGVAGTVATLYDTACGDLQMQATDPGFGSFNTVYLQPRSIDDLRQRRAAITRWAELTNGFVGRSPDHVGGFLAGFAAAPSVFDEHGEGTGARAVRWYREVAARDLYASYAIIPPQSGAQVAVVGETDEGIIVRGAQMLATGAAIADVILVSCIKPLAPGDEAAAISFIVPAAAEGLRIHCRRPYAPAATSSFDYPLSTRFDEPDAMLTFDDVLVPWQDVLVLRSTAGVRDQFHRTPAHVLGNSQAQIRLVVKTKFLLGLALMVCEANGVAAVPAVQDRLGELTSLSAMVEGMMHAAEATASIDEFGICRPNGRFLYGIMGLQAELYPRVLGILRELSGAGMIATTSSYRDLVAPEVRADLGVRLAASQQEFEDRTKLFKLAWDAVGSEFAGRHHQYEMFYAGAPFVARGYAHRNYGVGEARALASSFLDSYALPGAAEPLAAAVGA